MKTEIKKEGDTIVVLVNGYLDFENQVPLREHLIKLATQNKVAHVPKKVIFNLENLEFVGSSGISAFIQTLKEFDACTDSRPRYCHVKSEFQKLMKAFDDANIFEFYSDEGHARDSFDQ